MSGEPQFFIADAGCTEFQMIGPTQELRDFVERVIAFESKSNGSSGVAIPVAVAVCEKLRPPWANLMGVMGFRALLSRALKMASAEVPWLGTVQVRADGSLAATEKLDAHMDPKVITAGSVVLVTELLGLLEEFIGATLAMRLMQDTWPQLPPSTIRTHAGKRV